MKNNKKNLILISLDTLRADVAYSGKFKTIEKMRSRGITFLNTISSSPLTPASHATVFTGLQPYNHGIRHLFKEQLNSETITLAEALKKEGYQTGAIVSCPGMNKWYGFNRGFDSYDDEIPLLADGSDPLNTVDVKKRGTALKRANIVYERVIKWLDKKNNKDPFFLFLHFFDAHWPYEAPEKFGGDNIYEEEVAFSDYYLGKVFSYLEKNNLIENTTIVCFSDHGEDLEGMYKNDKGGKILGHPEELGHGCLLYDQTQKVILMINDPNIKNKQEIKSQVRLVDVAPTILDTLNIKNKYNDFDGLSLFSLIDGAKISLPAYSETFYPEEQTAATNGKFANTRNKVSLRTGDGYKIIYHLNSDSVEFYDLNKDPNEKNNLYKK